MGKHLALVAGAALLVSGCPSRSMEDTLPAYSKAFDIAFRRLGAVELSDTQSRISALSTARSPFEQELADLRRRQGEVNDLLVKAVELKKQGLADKKPAMIGEATRVAEEAGAKAQRLSADLERLNERLTAAGAPLAAPAPPRDPNARD